MRPGKLSEFFKYSSAGGEDSFMEKIAPAKWRGAVPDARPLSEPDLPMTGRDLLNRSLLQMHRAVTPAEKLLPGPDTMSSRFDWRNHEHGFWRNFLYNRLNPPPSVEDTLINDAFRRYHREGESSPLLEKLIQGAGPYHRSNMARGSDGSEAISEMKARAGEIKSKALQMWRPGKPAGTRSIDVNIPGEIPGEYTPAVRTIPTPARGPIFFDGQGNLRRAVVPEDASVVGKAGPGIEGKTEAFNWNPRQGLEMGTPRHQERLWWVHTQYGRRLFDDFVTSQGVDPASIRSPKDYLFGTPLTREARTSSFASFLRDLDRPSAPAYQPFPYRAPYSQRMRADPVAHALEAGFGSPRPASPAFEKAILGSSLGKPVSRVPAISATSGLKNFGAYAKDLLGGLGGAVPAMFADAVAHERAELPGLKSRYLQDPRTPEFQPEVSFGNILPVLGSGAAVAGSESGRNWPSAPLAELGSRAEQLFSLRGKRPDRGIRLFEPSEPELPEELRPRQDMRIKL